MFTLACVHRYLAFFPAFLLSATTVVTSGSAVAADQGVNESVDQAADQFANQSANLAVNQPADKPVVLDTVQVTTIRQPFRGDTPLQKLPQSVQILSSDLIKTVGATQLDSALDLASGVARQNTFGGLWDSFAIRGFAGDENSPSGYLVNGFSAGRGFSGRRDSSNIQSIEVLKGPGSALYGRGEPGGTVNIITKKPQFLQEGSLQLSGGSYDTYRFAADYTRSINSVVAFRINGAYQNADSFRDYFSLKKFSLTPSVLFKITRRTTLNYELEWVGQEAPFDRGVVALNNALGLIPRSRFLGEPNDGPIKINALGHQITLQQVFNGHWSLLVGANYKDSSFKGYSTEAELTTSRQLLYSNTGAGILSRQRRYRDYQADDLAGRVELNGKLDTGPIVHHLLFGVDAYRFNSNQKQSRFRPAAGSSVYAIDINSPVYGSVAPELSPFTNQMERQHAVGTYLQDQMDLTEHWKLLGGIRLDRFAQDIDFRLTSATAHQAQNKISPRAGLVYQVNEQVSLYTSYSEGFRPNSGSDFYGKAFKPEVSRSYEFGTKINTRDQRLTSAVAVYQGKKSNILTADPVNANFSIAAGEARSRGVEAEVSARITDDLHAAVNYAYTDAHTLNDFRDVSFGIIIPAGSRLINIPKHSGNVLVLQDIHLKNVVISVGASLNHVGSRLGETGNPSFELPSYTLVNLIGVCAPTPNLKFTMHVDNLLDRTYYQSSYARLWIAPGNPRAITLRAEYDL